MAKVKCQYCGKEYSDRGIQAHERACSENPVNQTNEEVVLVDKTKEEEEIVLVSKETEQKIKDIQEDEVTITKVNSKPPEPKKVKIKMAEYHRCNIGGQWYELFEDKTYNVPPNVKDILLKAGKLMPI